MKYAVLRAAAFCTVASAVAFASPLPVAAAPPIRLVVDVPQAPAQNVVRTHETIPVRPGPLTLYYPKWAPGEHHPVGPIANVADLTIRADGRNIPWRRNPLDMFAFETTVPNGVRSIDVDFTYLGATFGRNSTARLATPNMLVITWNQNLLYPSTGTIQDTIFAPSIVLPGENWKYATALYDPRRGGDLLSHEFNHSWDGKYRMPAGLYRKNLQLPYHDSLLWMYEGMTQYYGNVMSFRDGIRTAKDWPGQIASFWAYYDNEPGRKWRSLGDTAISGPFLIKAPRAYASERRGLDYYPRGGAVLQP